MKHLHLPTVGHNMFCQTLQYCPSGEGEGFARCYDYRFHDDLHRELMY